MRQKENHFAPKRIRVIDRPVQPNQVPLEDELGDVLDKAMRRADLAVEEVARRTGIPPPRLLDAIDYRSDLTCKELGLLAALLDLNEVGLCALAEGKYPLPEVGALPFCLHALRMPHGIGVVNAYLISEPGSGRGVLFDVGPSMKALLAVWPADVPAVDAIFLTHVETEHAGSLCDVVKQFGAVTAYNPQGVVEPCGQPIAEPAALTLGTWEITVLSTPGHAMDHNCYLVRSLVATGGTPLLIAGDLIFAGSAGAGYYCQKQSKKHLARVMALVPENTIIAPGHGPLTTVGNERRYNPFVN